MVLTVSAGVLLRFGPFRKQRPTIVLVHRVSTLLFVLSVLLHLVLVEAKPWYLILLAVSLVVIAITTIILKRLKKLSFAIQLKLVAVPFLALGLLIGHLVTPEVENDGYSSSEQHENEEEDD